MADYDPVADLTPGRGGRRNSLPGAVCVSAYSTTIP
jgi:hypothetical protein